MEMDNLFDTLPGRGYTPLAERLRPETLDEIRGQEHILGQGKPLRLAIENNALPSIILWGPPGCGKTTLASVIAHLTDSHFHFFSAILAGVKELRQVIEIARRQRRATGKKTILFVDEIHRFNKAQQDAFLPHVENGTIILIGATTENPSFEVISPLLSRAKVYVMEALGEKELSLLVDRALLDEERGYGQLEITITDEARQILIEHSNGDGRRILNTIELAVSTTQNKKKEERHITVDTLEAVLQQKVMRYDKSGEEHYNVISAFIKSMRGSSPDAALYYMARMLQAGENPLFVARRMVIFASEDVGNADPQAIQVAISAMQSLDFIGMPEGWIPLAQCASYLASAPKSNASYMAYKEALRDVEALGNLPVPLHLRNAPTRLMKELGYGRQYKYPHKYESHFVKECYLPEKIGDKIYYQPTEEGYERHISERLRKWRQKP